MTRHDIAFYRKEHRRLHARVDELEAEVAARDRREANAVIEAVAPLQQHIAELEAAAADTADSHRADLDQHDRAHAFRDGQIADSRRQLDTMTADRDSWRELTHQAASKTEQAQSLAIDAMVLVERVRGDIRRQADRDKAVQLNRRALAQALCIPAAESPAK